VNIHPQARLESRCFGGNRSGPRLLITAGVHGDEYLPMLAVRELIDRFESDDNLRDDLHGTLTLVPLVNRSAFQRGHRVGDDGKDLARICPGRREGTITEQLAYVLSRQIREASHYIDLHTGGTELCVLPLAGYVLHADRVILEQQRKMASAFRLPFLWGTSAELPGRSLSVARDAAVPAIYVEYLGAHRELAELAAGAVSSRASDHPLVSGCLNVMKHLCMLRGPEENGAGQEVIEDWRSASGHMQVCNRAPVSGFLRPKVSLGQQVTRGDLLAEIISETGTEQHQVVSQQAGKVVVVREYPRINHGNSVAVIAESCEAQ
jgi:predicted deacylase